ncbi:hypothetical protein SAY86_018564 [Trapa natans]|uniref:Uncharacterized protein n=1 Tax=Trapa natans TaxID=22666 RepID=A0AAN7LDG7_TRANT|nr:hypothetical protein SAY86_018564 [Trapa natans]
MENQGTLAPVKEELPSLIQFISSEGVSGFDEETVSPQANVQLTHEVSISMPSSPTSTKKVLLADLDEAGEENPSDSTPPPEHHPEETKFHSLSMATGENLPSRHQHSRVQDKRFDSFKTWSGRLERQLSNLRGKPRPPFPNDDDEGTAAHNPEMNLPVDRYFDALEGPELDTLRASEEIVLPEHKLWPFLLRFPISSFGICLGVSSQAIMWKTLASSPSMEFLHVSPTVNLVLWSIAIALVAIVFLIYLLKVVFYFEAVRREYYHPIRVNFFFAPWIALLFLALGVPPSVAEHLPHALWYVVMAPIFCLELKIYGQWMSGGQRRLSKVANPSNHLSIVGNFVGALLGASMGLKEGPIFFFAVGLAHYTVLFVTLYQRLPTNETLPKELHPVFFLFVAAPSVASMAWAKIQGSFDYGARIAYFVALFLYFSLAVRVNFFRGFRFSLAWWAYTFPMTGAAIATIRYANEVTNDATQALSAVLSSVATLTVTALLVATVLHAFVHRDLFPNDMAIAISERRPIKTNKKWLFHLRHGSSDTTKDIENYLKFTCSSTAKADVEAANINTNGGSAVAPELEQR